MPNENWLRIQITSPPQAWDAVAVALERVGCQGVELRDTPPGVTGYLLESQREQLEALNAHLRQFEAFGLPPVAPPQVESVRAEEWQKTWKRFFRSRRIGKRLRVQPTWSVKKPSPDDVTLYLDPGLAFGTGTHPTTALCLELLEAYLNPGDRVADLGTGTGILAIAAVKLGASEVWAVDNDPLAVMVAEENAERNRVSGRICALKGDGWNALEGSYHLILCNILSSFHVQTAVRIPDYLEPGGLYVPSGVIRENWAEVGHAIEAAGLASVEIRKKKQWVAAVYQKRT